MATPAIDPTSRPLKPIEMTPTERIVALLHIPFRLCQLKWRIDHMLNDGSGEAVVVPFVDKHHYKERLTTLVGIHGWSQTNQTTTLGGLNRLKMYEEDGQRVKKLINTGKIVITCAITIDGLGTKSSLGEGWADDDNGGTRAEVQAFRRTCAEFGLGRYLNRIYDECEFVVKVDRNRRFKFPLNQVPDWALHPADLKQRYPERYATPTPKNNGPQHTEPQVVSGTTQQPELPQALPHVNPDTAQVETTTTASSAVEVEAKTEAVETAPVELVVEPVTEAIAEEQVVEPQQQPPASQEGSGIVFPLPDLQFPEVKEQILVFREELSIPMIQHIVDGVSKAHETHKLTGYLIPNVICNLQRAANIQQHIEEMNTLLDKDTLMAVLKSYNATRLEEIANLGHLKQIERRLLTLYKAERDSHTAAGAE